MRNALVAAVLATGCSKPHAVAPSVAKPLPAPLVEAVRFLPFLHTDEDLANRWRAEHALALYRAGFPEAAETAAAEILDYRRGVVLARLAFETALKGQASESKRLVEQASATRKGQEGWRAEQIQAWCVKALAESGDIETAEKWAQEIQDRIERVRALAGLAMAKARRGAITEFKVIPGNRAVPEAEPEPAIQAEVFLAMAEFRVKAKSAASEIEAALRQAVELAKRDHIGQLATIRQAIEMALAAGLAPLAEELFTDTMQLTLRIHPMADFRSSELVRCSRLARALGKTVEAHQLVDAAAATGLKLPKMYRPQTLMEAVCAYTELGRMEPIPELVRAIEDAVRTNENPRMRALGAVAIFMTCQEFGVPLPPELAAPLEEVYQGLAHPAVAKQPDAGKAAKP